MYIAGLEDIVRIIIQGIQKGLLLDGGLVRNLQTDVQSCLQQV